MLPHELTPFYVIFDDDQPIAGGSQSTGYGHLIGEVRLNGEAGVVYLGEPNLVEWIGVKDLESGFFMNEIHPHWCILDLLGNILSQGDMAYVTGTNGNYRGRILASQVAMLREGKFYRFLVTDSIGAVMLSLRQLTFVPRRHSRVP